MPNVREASVVQKPWVRRNETGKVTSRAPSSISKSPVKGERINLSAFDPNHKHGDQEKLLKVHHHELVHVEHGGQHKYVDNATLHTLTGKHRHQVDKGQVHAATDGSGDVTVHDKHIIHVEHPDLPAHPDTGKTEAHMTHAQWHSFMESQPGLADAYSAAGDSRVRRYGTAPLKHVPREAFSDPAIQKGADLHEVIATIKANASRIYDSGIGHKMEKAFKSVGITDDHAAHELINFLASRRGIHADARAQLIGVAMEGGLQTAFVAKNYKKIIHAAERQAGRGMVTSKTIADVLHRIGGAAMGYKTQDGINADKIKSDLSKQKSAEKKAKELTEGLAEYNQQLEAAGHEPVGPEVYKVKLAQAVAASKPAVAQKNAAERFADQQAALQKQGAAFKTDFVDGATPDAPSTGQFADTTTAAPAASAAPTGAAGTSTAQSTQTQTTPQPAVAAQTAAATATTSKKPTAKATKEHYQSVYDKGLMDLRAQAIAAGHPPNSAGHKAYVQYNSVPLQVVDYLAKHPDKTVEEAVKHPRIKEFTDTPAILAARIETVKKLIGQGAAQPAAQTQQAAAPVAQPVQQPSAGQQQPVVQPAPVPTQVQQQPVTPQQTATTSPVTPPVTSPADEPVPPTQVVPGPDGQPVVQQTLDAFNGKHDKIEEVAATPETTDDAEEAADQKKEQAQVNNVAAAGGGVIGKEPAQETYGERKDRENREYEEAKQRRREEDRRYAEDPEAEIQRTVDAWNKAVPPPVTTDSGGGEVKQDDTPASDTAATDKHALPPQPDAQTQATDEPTTSAVDKPLPSFGRNSTEKYLRDQATKNGVTPHEQAAQWEQLADDKFKKLNKEDSINFLAANFGDNHPQDEDLTKRRVEMVAKHQGMSTEEVRAAVAEQVKKLDEESANDWEGTEVKFTHDDLSTDGDTPPPVVEPPTGHRHINEQEHTDALAHLQGDDAEYDPEMSREEKADLVPGTMPEEWKKSKLDGVLKQYDIKGEDAKQVHRDFRALVADALESAQARGETGHLSSEHLVNEALDAGDYSGLTDSDDAKEAILPAAVAAVERMRWTPDETPAAKPTEAPSTSVKDVDKPAPAPAAKPKRAPRGKANDPGAAKLSPEDAAKVKVRSDREKQIAEKHKLVGKGDAKSGVEPWNHLQAVEQRVETAMRMIKDKGFQGARERRLWDALTLRKKEVDGQRRTPLEDNKFSDAKRGTALSDSQLDAIQEMAEGRIAEDRGEQAKPVTPKVEKHKTSVETAPPKSKFKSEEEADAADADMDSPSFTAGKNTEVESVRRGGGRTTVITPSTGADVAKVAADKGIKVAPATPDPAKVPDAERQAPTPHSFAQLTENTADAPKADEAYVPNNDTPMPVEQKQALHKAIAEATVKPDTNPHVEPFLRHLKDNAKQLFGTLGKLLKHEGHDDAVKELPKLQSSLKGADHATVAKKTLDWLGSKVPRLKSVVAGVLAAAALVATGGGGGGRQTEARPVVQEASIQREGKPTKAAEPVVDTPSVEQETPSSAAASAEPAADPVQQRADALREDKGYKPVASPVQDEQVRDRIVQGAAAQESVMGPLIKGETERHQVPPILDDSRPESVGNAVADKALSMVGQDWAYPGQPLRDSNYEDVQGKKATKRIDCSGLASKVAGTPYMNTTSIYQDATGRQGTFKKVDAGDVQAGDMVCYPHYKDKGGAHHAGHVAIIVDPKTMTVVDSSESGGGVHYRAMPLAFAEHPESIVVRAVHSMKKSLLYSLSVEA